SNYFLQQWSLRCSPCCPYSRSEVANRFRVSNPGVVSASDRGRKRCLRIARSAGGRKARAGRRNSQRLSCQKIAKAKARRNLRRRKAENRLGEIPRHGAAR